MSNNAVDAYNRGLLPASKIKGIPAALIKEFCRYKEWHHTSKVYNATKFYDAEEVYATFGISETEDCPFWVFREEKAVEALKKWKQKNADGSKTYRANVEWLDWGGTRRRPVAIKKQAENVLVSEKGDWITFEYGGKTLKKKLSGLHLRVYKK